ncbi:MAG: tetratricopeptide repeat protein [Phenylobacterium sp.]|uniref:tetratricopeptide repeat protein n=1 Tax=Phenylobacterium sp. TaxID=1871053 RepID=UPI0025E52D73|nr:tetratricopeptide repeat protein [Phenylobacterium sp.]MBI1197729.1 tetratricopeptide repeat protein [Phenylobacterium sp.]
MTSADPFVVLSAANIRDACAHAASLQTAGRNGEAAGLWRRIVAAAPASAEARFNLGATLLALEEFEAAEHALRESARLRPGAPWTRHRLGNLLQATGRWDEAEPHYRAALAEDASLWRARLDLAHLCLGRGDFGRGWPLFEARRSLGAAHIAPPPLPREWAGEPPAGASILVWPEQGFGDQIQFARFAPALAAAGADVTLVAPPELSALFATLGVRVVERAAEMTLPEPDAWTFLLSIPQRLGVDRDGLWPAPYLAPPADRIARWDGFAPQGAVGVVWQGRATPNTHRSLPSRELLQPLADAGATLVDLQPPPGRDFADLAAVMAQLDLVVTIDTAAAHLAGALGKPCWVLLPWFNADWRWGLGDSTPWYPATRVFRQTAHGDWAGVMAEVAAAWRARQGA